MLNEKRHDNTINNGVETHPKGKTRPAITGTQFFPLAFASHAHITRRESKKVTNGGSRLFGSGERCGSISLAPTRPLSASRRALTGTSKRGTMKHRQNHLWIFAFCLAALGAAQSQAQT